VASGDHTPGGGTVAGNVSDAAGSSISPGAGANANLDHTVLHHRSKHLLHDN